MQIKRIILLVIILLVNSSQLLSQIDNNKTLTTVLNEINNNFKVKISYSPTYTDQIKIKETILEITIEKTLEKILTNTGFRYKKIGNHYIVYGQKAKQQKPIEKREQQEIKEEVKEKITQHAEQIPTFIPTTISSYITLSNSNKGKIDYSRYYDSTLIDSRNYDNILPILAIKTNLIYDITTTFNFGVEFGLGSKTTLDISGSYNPWTFSGNRKMNHWLIQPELRIWTCSRFSGGFWGIHAHYAQYNFGGMLPFGFNSGKMFGSIKNDNILNYRYKGWITGGGISYGYHWIVGKRWGVEAEIGAGYAHIKYDKYRCEKCSEKIGSGHKNYFGPTKAAVSLIYVLK